MRRVQCIRCMIDICISFTRMRKVLSYFFTVQQWPLGLVGDYRILLGIAQCSVSRMHYSLGKKNNNNNNNRKLNYIYT